LSTRFDEKAAGGPVHSSHASSRNQFDYEYRKGEAEMLRKAFLQARQILFVPLFEAELSHATAGCFAFATDLTRLLLLKLSSLS
jgi:hypothetical protein